MKKLTINDLIITESNKEQDCSICPLNGELHGIINSCDLNNELADSLRSKHGTFFCQKNFIKTK